MSPALSIAATGLYCSAVRAGDIAGRCLTDSVRRRRLHRIDHQELDVPFGGYHLESPLLSSAVTCSRQLGRADADSLAEPPDRRNKGTAFARRCSRRRVDGKAKGDEKGKARKGKKSRSVIPVPNNSPPPAYKQSELLDVELLDAFAQIEA